jgi:hypothetical protein
VLSISFIFSLHKQKQQPIIRQIGFVAANDSRGAPVVPPLSLLANMLQGAISSVSSLFARRPLDGHKRQCLTWGQVVAIAIMATVGDFSTRVVATQTGFQEFFVAP